MKTSTHFTLGLIINPLAGLGGPAGLKGSDAKETQAIAIERGVKSKVPERVGALLEGLQGLLENGFLSSLDILTCSGKMGLDLLDSPIAENPKVSITYVFDSPENTSGIDTQKAAHVISEQSPDLLIFAGGDGTARDVCKVVSDQQLVLGLPAGVKMHSGVFAVTPKSVVSVIESMLSHKLVAARLAEVRDIDEEAFRHGKVSAKYYGEMLIPDDQLLVQAVKCSGMLDDEIMLDELSEYILETLQPDTVYVLGSGGTLNHIKQALDIDSPTLLGVDVIYVDATGCIEVLATDIFETALYDLLANYASAKLILSVIGGQGIVLGRGNQQLSERVIRRIGLKQLSFVSTQSKLLALEGRALQVDSGSDALNKELSGFHPIICGYDDTVLYEIAYG